jgi:ABC-type transporter Mla subunit MlaD
MSCAHRRLGVAVALVGSFILAGCSGTPRLSIREFTDAANEECAALQQASDDFRKAQDPSFTGDEVADFVHNVADRLRVLAKNLEELLGVLSDYAHGLDELADATGPGQTFQGVLQERTGIVNGLNALAPRATVLVGELGLVSCILPS